MTFTRPVFLRSFLAVLIGFFLMTVTASQAQTVSPTFAQRAALFHYDPNIKPSISDDGLDRRDRISIRDITLQLSPDRPAMKAYLVVPDGSGPFAGVLWVHWLGDKNSDRSEFLEEAVTLARKGTVSLLVNAMWADPDWYPTRNVDQDYHQSIQQVIDLRRAFDLLAAQPGVDSQRIGFVGHDYGGMYGAVAMALDGRVRSAVLIAMTQSFTNWAFFVKQPTSKVEYLRQNAVLDLTDYLAQLKNVNVLGQFANGDPYVSRADSLVIMNALPKKGERKFYDAGHDMVSAAAQADRLAWLTRDLNLQP